MLILLDESIPDADGLFCPLGEVRFFSDAVPRAEDLSRADALVVRSVTRVDATLLHRSSVRFVGTLSSGVDHLDCAGLASGGIHVASAAGCNARTVAEYVLTAVLALSLRRKQGPCGRTLGVVGVGRIGSIVSEWAEALGMNVLRCDPPREDAGEPGPWTSLDELLQRCDLVTLHVPLSAAGPYPTRNLLDRAGLRRMKLGAILINTARGEVVAEDALQSALRAGQIGAVLDVWRGEPAVSAQLVGLCELATPHVAGYSREAKRRAAIMIAEQLAVWSQGGPIAVAPTATRLAVHEVGSPAATPDAPAPRCSSSDPHLPETQQTLARVLDNMLRACDILTMDKLFKAAVQTGITKGTFDALRATWLDRTEFPAYGPKTFAVRPGLAHFLKEVGFRAHLNRRR